MRASIFFAFGLAGLSSALNAQQCLNYAVNNLPACGLGCIVSAAPAVGCGAADIACQCGKYQDLQAAALNCVISGCGAETGIQVQSIAQGLCSGDCTGGKSGSACLNYAVNSIPTCGLNCIISAAGKVGCGPTDISCQCGKYAQLQNDALNCVISGCGAETGIQVQSLAQNLCAGKCSGGSSGGSSGSGSSAPASSAAATTAAASSAAASSAAASSDDMGGMGSSAAASTAAAASPSSGGSSSSGSGSAPVTAGAALVAGSVTTVMGAMLALIAAL